MWRLPSLEHSHGFECTMGSEHALVVHHIYMYTPSRQLWAAQDRPNGVMAFERTEGSERLVAIVNAGRSSFQARAQAPVLRQDVDWPSLTSLTRNAHFTAV